MCLKGVNARNRDALCIIANVLIWENYALSAAFARNVRTAVLKSAVNLQGRWDHIVGPKSSSHLEAFDFSNFTDYVVNKSYELMN